MPLRSSRTSPTNRQNAACPCFCWASRNRCGSCGEEYAAVPAPEKLHKLIGQEICRSRKALLLPEEIKFLRKELGLKGKELAASLGVEDATVSRWENGKQQIGEGSDRLLRALYLSCTEESLPPQRKAIREQRKLSLNPQDWLCACPA